MSDSGGPHGDPGGRWGREREGEGRKDAASLLPFLSSPCVRRDGISEPPAAEGMSRTCKRSRCEELILPAMQDFPDGQIRKEAKPYLILIGI